jgi:hypothetical protein
MFKSVNSGIDGNQSPWVRRFLNLDPGQGDGRGTRQEEAAHRIAWAAVKRVYVKSGNEWVRQH